MATSDHQTSTTESSESKLLQDRRFQRFKKTYKQYKKFQTSSNATPPPQFYFKPRREKLNWRVLLSIPVDQVMDEVNIDTLENITRNITFSHIDVNDLRHFTEENFAHIFRLAQLIIEYLLFVQNHLESKRVALEEDAKAIFEEAEKYRSQYRKKVEEYNYLKKEMKRQKRTIFAYQLAFGATPEKAKIILQGLQQKKLQEGVIEAEGRTKETQTPREMMEEYVKKDAVLETKVEANAEKAAVIQSHMEERFKSLEHTIVSLRNEVTSYLKEMESIKRKPEPMVNQQIKALEEEIRKVSQSCKEIARQNEMLHHSLKETQALASQKSTPHVQRVTPRYQMDMSVEITRKIEEVVVPLQKRFRQELEEKTRELEELKAQLKETQKQIQKPAEEPKVKQHEVGLSKRLKRLQSLQEDRKESVVPPLQYLIPKEQQKPEVSKPPPPVAHNLRSRSPKKKPISEPKTSKQEAAPEKQTDVQVIESTDTVDVQEDVLPLTKAKPIKDKPFIESFFDHETKEIEVQRISVESQLKDHLKQYGVDPNAKGLTSLEFKEKMDILRKEREHESPEFHEAVKRIRKFTEHLTPENIPPFELPVINVAKQEVVTKETSKPVTSKEESTRVDTSIVEEVKPREEVTKVDTIIEEIKPKEESNLTKVDTIIEEVKPREEFTKVDTIIEEIKPKEESTKVTFIEEVSPLKSEEISPSKSHLMIPKDDKFGDSIETIAL